VKSERQIILEPLMSEKMSILQDEENKVAFIVDKGANKIEIQRAVEERFQVKVQKVATVNVQGKVKRLGRHQGKQAGRKKAIVTLRDGFKIDFFEGK
jgi:large subunit ribosomal protein L23